MTPGLRLLSRWARVWPSLAGARSPGGYRETEGDPLQATDFTLLDQKGVPWALSEHLDTARIVVFLRGDW